LRPDWAQREAVIWMPMLFMVAIIWGTAFAAQGIMDVEMIGVLR